MIDWHRRCKKYKSQVADCRRWASHCGIYRVEESDIRYGRKWNSKGKYLGYKIYYRAMVHHLWGWEIISTHQKKSAAYKSLEFYAEHGYVKPKPKKRRKRVRDVSDQDKERENE
jgi:hypothetical protein